MNIFREQLNAKNSLGNCEKQNVTWEVKEKTNTPPKQLRGKGEIPIQFEQYNSSSGSSHSSSSNKKSHKHKKGKSQKNMNRPSQNHHQFSHIGPSVREVNGGWNTQSNEAYERRHRERQQKLIEENIEQKLNNSCNINSSSTSSDSYKTTLQDSYEIKVAHSEQETSETLTRDINLQRYKKNALMLGLLRSAGSADYSDVDREDTPTESSGDYFDTSSFDGVANGILNLNIDENELQSERIGRFFQSQEDEDVYYHPLKEQIQKDPEWQNLRLKRKGIETIQSPRQYYLSIPDEDFAFEIGKPK